jgi:TP901 family phage tail tape measure protein
MSMNISFRVQAIDDFSSTMRSLDNQVSGVTKTIGGIGTAMTAAGVGLATGLGFAVNSAADFEAQMSSIKALTGATGGELQQISNLAMEMGEQTKYSAVEAGQGLEELLKAGVTLSDAINGGLEGALNLAVAGELELADAAEIASTALNAFKADALTVSKAGDILAGAANASATSVGELKYGLSMVSAVASGVGLSFKDTSTALALFANSGLKGSDGGTSLKTMLMNLIPATNAQYESFMKLGLLTKQGTSAFFDASGQLKSMADIAGLLQTSMKGMTDEQRLATMETMFGSDAIRAANILYQEGAQGIKDMASAMSEVTAADVAAEKMNNLKGQVEELKGAFETAAISIGTALLPPIKIVVGAIQSMVDWFNGLSSTTKTTIATVAALSAAFMLIVGPILMFIGFLPSIKAGLAMILPALKGLGALLTGTTGIVIAVVAALALIGYGLYKAYQECEWFHNVVNAVWAKIKAIFSTALNAISGVVTSVMNAIGSFINSKLNVIKSFWAENGAMILQGVKNYWTPIGVVIGAVMGTIFGVMKTIWPAIKILVVGVWGGIKTVIGGALDVILGVAMAFGALFTGNWEKFGEAISQIIKGALQIVVGIFKMNLLLYIPKMLVAFVTAIKEQMGGAKDKIVDIWNKVTAFFKGIDLREIGADIMRGLVNGMTSMVSEVMNKAKEIASSVKNAVKDALNIHSPSRVMMELGSFIGEGLSIGIDKSQMGVIKSATNLAGASMPSVSRVQPIRAGGAAGGGGNVVNIEVNGEVIDELAFQRFAKRISQEIAYSTGGTR